jgi:hypothetical protein
MNMRRKLSVSVAALIVSTQLGSSLGVAAPSAGQLAVLQGHLEARDYGALAEYLTNSPDLLSDTSPLSQTLNRFMADYQTSAFRPYSDDVLATLESMMAEACRSTGGSGGARECSIY